MNLVGESLPETLVAFEPTSWSPSPEQIAMLSPFVSSRERAIRRGSAATASMRQLLSKAVRTTYDLIPDNKINRSTAVSAIKAGGGDCLAADELLTALLGATSTPVDTYYDGTHFWGGVGDATGLWYIDGYYSTVQRAGEPILSVVPARARKVNYPIGRVEDAYFDMDVEANKLPHGFKKDSTGDWCAHPLSYEDALSTAVNKSIDTCTSDTLFIPNPVVLTFLQDYVATKAAELKAPAQ
jgi:hypothetical protein